MKKPKIGTSIKLDRELFADIKEMAVKQNRSFGNLVESVMLEWMESQKKE